MGTGQDLESPGTLDGSRLGAKPPGGIDPVPRRPPERAGAGALREQGILGTSRNTEQTGALAVNYSQTAHPGRIRIPLGAGELWQAANNSQNMLIRGLPVDWTSIRLKIASFNPTRDFQQVGLLVYQDDDTYVNVQRNFNLAAGGPVVGFFSETGGVTTRTDRRPLSNSGNLLLRLDRDPTTNRFSTFYSVDDGLNWVQLVGAPAVTLSDARLAIQVGADVSGAGATAELAWVEILR